MLSKKVSQGLTNFLTNSILNICNNFIPNKIISIRDKDAPWMTIEIKRVLLDNNVEHLNASVVPEYNDKFDPRC